MKIYTKQGDGGMSSLFGGKKVPKDHPRLAAYGTIDEVNCHLGLAIAACRHDALKAQLAALQLRLFDLGADLATPADAPTAGRVKRVTEADVAALERQIDEATDQLPALKRFILPGGGPTAAHLHVARATCRRAERELGALFPADVAKGGHPAAGDTISEQSFIFVNRLSDLLFVLARRANQLDGIADVEWNPAK